MAILLKLNKRYRSRGGDVVDILTTVKESELCYKSGFRFRDQNQEVYKENGSWTFDPKKKTDKDLIEELPDLGG